MQDRIKKSNIHLIEFQKESVVVIIANFQIFYVLFLDT